MTRPQLTLSCLDGLYAVAQLPADVPLPQLGGPFFSLTRTADELSLVCREDDLPPTAKAQGGWVAFKLHGPFDFDLTGVLASVLEPLRLADIGIFALSTFDTDYVLVQQSARDKAIAALNKAGHTVLAGQSRSN